MASGNGVRQVDEESWGSTPAFAVELVVEGDGYTGFSPSFAQLEDVCLQALEQCVIAAGSIPRVGSAPNQGTLQSNACTVADANVFAVNELQTQF